MTEHTPGPWGVERQEDLCPDGNGYIWAIKAKRKSEEKNADGGWKHYVQNPAYANSEANARLIAAAPELLAALKDVAEQIAAYDYLYGENSGAIDDAPALAVIRELYPCYDPRKIYRSLDNPSPRPPANQP